MNAGVTYTLIDKDHLGNRSPLKDCFWWLTFRRPVRSPSSESSDLTLKMACVKIGLSEDDDLTLKMASIQVVKTSVTNNSPSQDSNHPDDLFQLRKIIIKILLKLMRTQSMSVRRVYLHPVLRREYFFNFPHLHQDQSVCC